MAYQPDTFSTDSSATIHSMDFEQFIFSPDGFRPAYENLTLSQDIGTLNTPTLETTNPFISSTPGYVSTDSSASNGFMDSERFGFSPDGFRPAYENLTLSQGIETFDTLTFETTNPFVLPIPESCFNDSNAISVTNFADLLPVSFEQVPSISPEIPNEEIEVPIPETQMVANGSEDNSDNHVDAHAQETIAAPESILQSAIDEISNSTDLRNLVDAVNSHPNPEIRMHMQPLAVQRFRYRTDGIRHLKGSRRNPMSVELPILAGCLTKFYQSFWLELTLVTTRRNPQRRIFFHQHEMLYNGAHALQIGLGCFRIQLTESEIRNRRKVFRYLSIIKTKLEDYTFQLTPFDPLVVDNNILDYTLENEEHLTKVQKSKRFDTAYHTNEYKIICQLIIRQKDQWYMTDLHCETCVIHDS